MAVLRVAALTAALAAVAAPAAAAGPRIKSIECVAACTDGQPRGGSLVVVRGSGLDRVERAFFDGGEGGVKALRGRARVSSTTAVRVRVPWEAVTGGVSLATRDGQITRERRIRIADIPVISRMRCRASCAPGRRPRPGSLVQVSGVRLGAIASGLLKGGRGRADNRRARVSHQSFSGFRMRIPLTARRGQVIARERRGGDRSPARRIRLTEATSIRVVSGGVFPIRGRHDYGGSGARFGSGRSGHRHQGQDVFAACGTPMVSATAGTVQYAGSQSAAGYYVVIDGDDPAWDYVYMHLQRRSPLRKGDTVAAGQSIGAVGETGNAQGCHLHFEIWGAPGWYEGGKPFDPYPQLKAWDGAPVQLARR